MSVALAEISVSASFSDNIHCFDFFINLFKFILREWEWVGERWRGWEGGRERERKGERMRVTGRLRTASKEPDVGL